MNFSEWSWALAGGSLIGLSATLMLYFNGRVTGISGIVNGLLCFRKKDMLWRWTFVAGLILGGLALRWLLPEAFEVSDKSFSLLAVAGFLVGFGTVMGSGCTSGHGVCGISRFSLRSLAATVVFILSGFVTVAFLRTFL